MKKITRPQNDRMIAGVLSGIGNYYEIDPNLLRLGFVLMTFFTCFTGVLFYIVAWFILPEDELPLHHKMNEAEALTTKEKKEDGEEKTHEDRTDTDTNKDDVSRETNNNTYSSQKDS